MKGRSYAAYKTVGVHWLTQIPSHWAIDRLKWTVNGCHNGTWGNEPDGVNDIACIRVADFDRVGFRVNIEEPTIRSVTLSERQGRILDRGHLLLEKSGGGELHPVGRVVSYDHDTPAVCSNFIACMPVRDQWNSRFLVYLHAHLYDAKVNTRSIKQTTGIQNLDSRAYLDELGPIPPLDEQIVIADFLDRETTRIDALIANKERQIELLQEKRTALIAHHVTRGWDATVPFRDSGLNWLGHVPAHWVIAPVYARYEVALGKMLDSKRVTGKQLAPYLRNINVRWDRVNLDDVAEMDFSLDERRRYSLRPGDILVCEGGVGFGRTAIWRGELTECYYQKAIHRVRPKSSSDLPRFFYYVMYAAAHLGVFHAGGNPNTFDHLTAEQLRMYRFPFPPPMEQQHIITVLDTMTTNLDAIVTKIEQSIDYLKEYRSALITATVAGKIDVREEITHGIPAYGEGV